MNKPAYIPNTSASLLDQSAIAEPEPESLKNSFGSIRQHLNTQSHIFIVLLGMLLGSTIALAIGHSIAPTLIHFLFLGMIPITMSYILRQVYIYTLIHYQE